jgi:hypothetical protein
MKLSERRLIIKFAASAYHRFNPTNDTGFMVEDSLIHALEEFDSGYDLTDEEYKKLLADVSGEIHRRARMEDPDLKLIEVFVDEKEEQLRKRLSTYYFTMVNNQYPEGNKESFDEHDVNMIIGDMKMSELLRARAYTLEDGRLFVRYPSDICQLIQLEEEK